jgi:hypothetical protein
VKDPVERQLGHPAGKILSLKIDFAVLCRSKPRIVVRCRSLQI